MSRTLLIDGDVIAFRFAVTGERTYSWDGDEGMVSIVVDEDEVRKSVDRWTEQIVEKLGADHVLFALSDPSRRYFRHDIYPAYKQHRTHGRRPATLSVAKQYITEKYPSKVKPALEADDILGILGTVPNGGERVIVAVDKDLKQIPGLHYDPTKPSLGVWEVSEADGDRWFYYQTLVGDTCDGYPGCPGVGPVKTAKILDGVGPLWPRVVETFAARGKDEAFALQQARVARVLRYEDWDFTAQRPILWTPPDATPTLAPPATPD